MAGDDKPDRDALTPTHNTGTFAVFADSSREWAAKCLEISKDPTREMATVRLPAAKLAVRLQIAADVFKEWLQNPSRRPDVVGRGPVVAAYQELAGETIRFLGGLGARARMIEPVVVSSAGSARPSPGARRRS